MIDRLRLGIDAYSLRAFHWKDIQLIDYAASGCICPVSSAFQPKTKNPAQYLSDSLRTANQLGVKVMRCFISSPAERRGGVPVQKYIESTIQVLRSARREALDLGLKIAV